MGTDIRLPDPVELAPGVRLHAGALADSSGLIDRALAQPDKWVDSKLGSGAQAARARNSSSFLMDSGGADWNEVHSVIRMAAHSYNNNFDASWNGTLDRVTMLRYLEGDGFYVPHYDDSSRFPRAFSMLIYLNDVVEGGETEFTALGLSVRPAAGDLVVFPAQPPYVHQACVPTVGDKFVIATFCPRARWAHAMNEETL